MTERSEAFDIDSSEAEEVWQFFAVGQSDDILARAAYERVLQACFEIESDGLYFRPGGWRVSLPSTFVRVGICAGILAACFHLAEIDDLDREIYIAAATMVASVDLRPVRPSRKDARIASRLQQLGLDGIELSAKEARRALPKHVRSEVDSDDVADALDRLVAAGWADRAGTDAWLVRSPGKEAWLRISLA